MNARDSTMKRVGMIGAGRMGQPMIGHIAKKGFPIAAYDIDAAKRAAVEAKGGRWEPDLAKLAQSCDVVLICVGYDRELRQLLGQVVSYVLGRRPRLLGYIEAADRRG